MAVEQGRSRRSLVAAAALGGAATLLILAIVGRVGGYHLARVETTDVYVTAVNAGQDDIGYTTSADGDVLGTYDLRGLEAWADGEDGQWIPVGADVVGGRPSCIPPGSYGARVRLTVVRSAFGSGADINHVTRLRCLQPPTSRAASRA
jgi:hypothetical protein